MLEPWQVIGSTISYEDRWLKIQSDRCLTKTGKFIEPYHVLHYPTWVNVVALTANAEIILLSQYRHGVKLINPASIALHEAVGFTLVGVYQAVGYELGQWYDVAWWQLSLQQEQSEIVNPPLSWQEVEKSLLWYEALKSGLNFLRV
ncbi:hypothetical protein F7734_25545 [Scytonema sp. UIC 10036]|uniref:GNAT family N-acetyltransferase n=1 Tax=Scytonema sp. UIC 10036 TaxID=2304196 RepID=UPI0012DA0D9A|nr:hypothetical protein [Scytonema sp. UIC 10036]MUG95543.1 hypothetical protein [Scytonema sp. UIC 10036]